MTEPSKQLDGLIDITIDKAKSVSDNLLTESAYICVTTEKLKDNTLSVRFPVIDPDTGAQIEAKIYAGTELADGANVGTGKSILVIRASTARAQTTEDDSGQLEMGDFTSVWIGVMEVKGLN